MTISPAIGGADIGLPRRRSVISDYREILLDFWHYRELLGELARRDVRIRYKQAVMGFGWAVFMPVLIVLSGCLVRFAMAQTAGGSLNRLDVAGIAVKAVPWAFFVGSLNFGTISLTANINLVSKIYFPREVLPLSATLAQAFDAGIGSIALACLLPLLGARPGLALLWVPVLVVLLLLLTSATTLFSSCANLFFRDVKYIVQVLVTFGIFFTPVFFDPATLGATGSRIVMLNPLAPILEGLRLAVIHGHNLLDPLVTASATGRPIVQWTPWFLAYSAAWAILGFLGASLLFHRAEYAFAEYV